jgi:L-fuculose-phosphate aldolase
MKQHIEIKLQMIAIAQELHAKKMLAAADGNISYRLNENEILITPRGRAKSTLKPDDIATMTLTNEIKQGAPSSERLMHLSVYHASPKARCVIHAHPATAIAWTIARPDLTELPGGCLSELILAAGRVPVAPYVRPGTQFMGDVLQPFLPEHRIIILARHGALTWGEDLQEALNGMERLEHTAEILMRAEMLGGITLLPDAEIEELHQLRKQIGERVL